MKKTFRLFALFLFSIFTIVSCAEEPVTIIQPVQVASVNASIKGTLDIPDSSNVSASDIWIKVVCDGDTKSISRANADGGFVVSGLREDERYNILFTTEKPETANEKSISRKIDSTNGYGGWLSNVTATIDEGNNVGYVSIRPLGTIKGKVLLDGQTDHSDILVCIPGTSFSSYTNSDGSFFMYNVPEGTYLLKAIYLKSGYEIVMSGDVSIRGSKTSEDEHPVVQLDDIVLCKDYGVLEGKVVLDTDESSVGIAIMIKSENGLHAYTSVTDDSGLFRIDNIKSGVYTVYASKSGFDSAIVKDVVVVPGAAKIVPVQTLSSGVRSVSGRVCMEAKTDHSGALITATNTKDTNLVYSAITNADGDYSLVNMKPGQYRIVISANNYYSVTPGVISVLTDSVVNIGTSEMTILRGCISGTASLEGRETNTGIIVELLKGTDVIDTTITDDSGVYAFNVPQGNYSGIRFICENFKSLTIAQNITLMANDSVVIDTNADLIATHIPVVRGRLTVKGLPDTDYSGISVTLVEKGLNTTTNQNGDWSFFNVPVGQYTIKFERENANPVIMSVDIVPAAEINVGSIELIPNAASIEGHVFLNGLTDYSGIVVRATAEGMADLSTNTNAAGYFYLGNLVTTKTYTIHFEKAGWESQTMEVSGFVSLSINNITEENPITLIDTTAPVLNAIMVAVCNSEIDGRKISVLIDATEEGSGLSKVYVNTIDDFSNIEPINFSNPLSCFVPDAVGDYTLYVKVEDMAGHESATLCQSYSINNSKEEVFGVLIDDDGIDDGIVTWTKEKGPYNVTGHLLVDENTTLIIEPGVNVQFSGEFYIQVEGILMVNGTEEDKVLFYGVGDGEDTWAGINCVYSRGSFFKYASIMNMAEGIQGYVTIVDSVISASHYALGANQNKRPFYGFVENSDINGSVNIEGGSLLRNSVVIGDSSRMVDVYLSGNSFSGTSVSVVASAGENNEFHDMSVLSRASGMVNSSFDSCSVSLIDGGLYWKCELINCDFDSFSPAIIRESNIVNCSIINVQTAKLQFEIVDLGGNYWGESNTIELNSKGLKSNLSFLIDYYDDFNNTRIDVSGFKVAAIQNIGYLGDEYYPRSVAVKEYSIGEQGPAGGIVIYDKGYYSGGWRYIEAAPCDARVFDNEYSLYTFGIYRATNASSELSSGTAKGIGSGKLNTTILVETMQDSAYSSFDTNETTSIYAAKDCFDFSYNGFDNWFLPSRDELRQLINNIASIPNPSLVYWSSSEFVDGIEGPARVASYYDWPYNIDGHWLRSGSASMNARPIRYF